MKGWTNEAELHAGANAGVTTPRLQPRRQFFGMMQNVLASYKHRPQFLEISINECVEPMTVP